MTVNSLVSPTSAPAFEQILLKPRYRKDKSQIPYSETNWVDLLAANVVGEIHYYETVFSPTITANITIVNPNIKSKIFEDFSLNGGELIIFKLKDIHTAEEKTKGIKFFGVVSQVTDYAANNFAEVFRLRVTTEWEFPKGSGVEGNITGKTTDLAQQILGGAYSLNQNDILIRESLVNSSSNQIPFFYDESSEVINEFNIAREKKDNTMAILMKLASLSKTAPKGGREGTPGFFFYRNARGYFLRSIDGIIEDGRLGIQPKNLPEGKDSSDINFPAGELYTYRYEGYNPGIEGKEDFMESAFVAMFFKIQSNDYQVKHQLRLTGSFLSQDINTLKYNMYESVSNEDSFEQYATSLSSNVYSYTNYEDAANVNYYNKNIENLGLTYSFTDTAGIGSTESIKFSVDSHSLKERNRRYAKIMAVSVTMVVPLNLNLLAGTMINVEVPKTVLEKECTFENDAKPSDYQGLYIIAAVCHAMDVKKGYTSLHLVRDFGKLRSSQLES
jgi:hypothetical protein